MNHTTYGRCFLAGDKIFNGLKHLTEKVTTMASLIRVRVVVDRTMSTPLQRSTKMKI